jgi:phosphoribosylformylglycinamidine synthase
VLTLPIAHGEGNYVCPPDELAALEARGQVLLRYCDAQGRPSPQANPNGSTAAIAGLVNARGNVFGLMPHPERASEAALGSADGRLLFESLIRSFAPAENLVAIADRAAQSPPPSNGHLAEEPRAIHAG